MPIPIGGTADVRKVLLGTDGVANKPQFCSKPQCGQQNPGSSCYSQQWEECPAFLIKQIYCYRWTEMCGIQSQTVCICGFASEQLHGWHLEIQEMIMKTTALSTCMLSGGNYFWKWCAHCLLDLVCCPVSKVLSFLQGLLNDAKSLSTLKVCGRHFGPSWHRGRHLLLSS